MSLIVNSNANVSSALLAASKPASTNASASARLDFDLTTAQPGAASTGLTGGSNFVGADLASQALDRAASISDAATGAGAVISDTLLRIRQTVVEAAEPATTGAARAALSAKYQTLVHSVGVAVTSAGFDGANLLDGSSEPAGVSFQTSGGASGTVTLHGADLKPGGAIVSLPASVDLSTPTSAKTALDQVDTSIVATQGALARIDTQTKSVSAHADALSTLSYAGASADTTDTDTANLIALQVRQQLGAQSASLVNRAPQSILSLFKS